MVSERYLKAGVLRVNPTRYDGEVTLGTSALKLLYGGNLLYQLN